MTRSEFLVEFAELVNVPVDRLTQDAVLSSFEGWESVAVLSLLVVIDEKLGIAVRPENLSRAVTFGDIIKVVESGFKD